jgi:hypothetical protein
MRALAPIPENEANLTIEQRIELVLDLTRRVEMLDDLLSAARERRCATDTEVSVAEVDRAEIDAMLVL